MQSDRGYPMPLREAKRVRIGSLSDDERDPPTDDSMLQQHLDMSTDIRTEDRDPGIGGPTPIRLRSVRHHLRRSCAISMRFTAAHLPVAAKHPSTHLGKPDKTRPHRTFIGVCAAGSTERVRVPGR
jgi:hypothetical protein